jgi:hypothetical protein
MAAARLHQQLGLRKQIESRGGNVDVFSAIQTVNLPLLLRPLQGLLGAYLSDPTPGVLVTTQRPMSIQRFTAAHELGHFSLRHQLSLDDESILRRMPIAGQPTYAYTLRGRTTLASHAPAGTSPTMLRPWP